MNKELIIPVYMNQKIVFDLLAIFEDGFSQMRTIQKQQSDQKSNSASIDGEVGLSNVFSFLGVKLKGGIKGDTSKKDDKTINEERVHTPTSLFSKLLIYLEEDKKIKQITDVNSLKEIKTGDFIKFKGTLKMNPLIKVFDSFSKMMELIVSFEDKPQQGNKNLNTSKNQNKQVVSQIKSLTDSLKLGGMIDLICEISSGIEAIIQTEIDFFNNKNISQIEEGEYCVLGKVVKISDNSSEKSISLLRNTSISLAKQSFMDLMLTQLNSPELTKSGFEIPEIKTNILNGILVIPIAIYT